MKHKLAALVIAVLMTVTLTAQADKYEEPVMMYVVCNDYVNVRTRPSTKADVGGYLEFGWDIEVVGVEKDKCGNEWYEVVGVTEEGHGYVYASYLLYDEPVRMNEDYYVEANGRVALYDKVNGKRTGWAKNGSSLHVKIWSEEWALTNRGWIRSMYIAPDNT